MALPMTSDQTAYRGDTFLMVVRLWEDAAMTQPCDLSGASLAAQIRTSANDPRVVTSFGIAVSGNVVTLGLSPEQADVLETRGVWDLEVDWLSDRTNVQTVVRGAFTAVEDVTRVLAVSGGS